MVLYEFFFVFFLSVCLSVMELCVKEIIEEYRGNNMLKMSEDKKFRIIYGIDVEVVH